MLSAIQLSKRVKWYELTFLVVLKLNIATKPMDATPIEVLESFRDVMPPELPKRLPPKREVNHKIELVPNVQPPAHAPCRMSPPELE